MMTRVMTPRICPRLGPVSMSSGWIVVVASEVDSSSPTSLLGIAVFSCVLTEQLQHLACYLVCPAQDVIRERKRQDKPQKEKMGEVLDREVLDDQKWLRVGLLENSISPPPPPADHPMFPPHAPPRPSPPPSLVGVTSLVQRGCAMYWCWCPAPLLVRKLVLGAGEVAAGCSATGALHPAVHADLLQG